MKRGMGKGASAETHEATMCEPVTIKRGFLVITTQFPILKVLFNASLGDPYI